MKLKDLFEEQEQSLVGMTINGKKLPVEGKWEGYFDCSYSHLTSLEGAPTTVSGNFDCYGNHLTSLEGAPASIGGRVYCGSNQLTSLKDIHKQIKNIKGPFHLDQNPIKNHVIGLLLIDGLTEIFGDEEQPWVPILNSAIKQFDDKRKRVMWAQAELVKQLGEEGKALAQL